MKVYSYLIVLVDCKFGVCVYEFGYLVFGWLDLYDVDYILSGIGDWCLMVGGSYNGNEDNFVILCVWCKVD